MVLTVLLEPQGPQERMDVTVTPEFPELLEKLVPLDFLDSLE